MNPARIYLALVGTLVTIYCGVRVWRLLYVRTALDQAWDGVAWAWFALNVAMLIAAGVATVAYVKRGGD